MRASISAIRLGRVDKLFSLLGVFMVFFVAVGVELLAGVALGAGSDCCLLLVGRINYRYCERDE